MKLLRYSVCLTSKSSILIIVSLLLSTIVIASVWPRNVAVIEEKQEEAWIPTAEDIADQDSMYQRIKGTQNDISDIKKDIVHILERLDYEDGSWDSIRYVKGGAIDKRRNKQ